MNNDTYANYHDVMKHFVLAATTQLAVPLISHYQLLVHLTHFFPKLAQTQICHHSSFSSHFAVFTLMISHFYLELVSVPDFLKVYTATYNFLPIHHISYFKYTHRKLNLHIFILHFFVFIIEFIVVKQKLSQLT